MAEYAARSQTLSQAECLRSFATRSFYALRPALDSKAASLRSLAHCNGSDNYFK